MLERLIETWGYAAVAAGTFFEGETVVVLAGIFARQGHLTLWGVMLASFVGSFAGDQLWFFVGKRYASRAIQRFPRLADRLNRAKARIARGPDVLALTFRFLYGLRTATPFALGMVHYPTRRFLVFNLIGGVLWAVIVPTLGFVFGHALELFLHDVRAKEAYVLVGIAAVVALAFVIRGLRARRRRERAPA